MQNRVYAVGSYRFYPGTSKRSTCASGNSQISFLMAVVPDGVHYVKYQCFYYTSLYMPLLQNNTSCCFCFLVLCSQIAVLFFVVSFTLYFHRFLVESSTIYRQATLRSLCKYAAVVKNGDIFTTFLLYYFSTYTISFCAFALGKV